VIAKTGGGGGRHNKGEEKKKKRAFWDGSNPRRGGARMLAYGEETPQIKAAKNQPRTESITGKRERRMKYGPFQKEKIGVMEKIKRAQNPEICGRAHCG